MIDIITDSHADARTAQGAVAIYPCLYFSGQLCRSGIALLCQGHAARGDAIDFDHEIIVVCIHQQRKSRCCCTRIPTSGAQLRNGYRVTAGNSLAARIIGADQQVACLSSRRKYLGHCIRGGIKRRAQFSRIGIQLAVQLRGDADIGKRHVLTAQARYRTGNDVTNLA